MLETTRFSIQDDGSIIYQCLNTKDCRNFTLQELLSPILRDSVFFIELPRAQVDQLDCSKPYIQIGYNINGKLSKETNTSYQFTKSTTAGRCKIVLDLAKILENSNFTSLQNQPAIEEIKGSDYDRLNFYLHFYGLPQNGRFYMNYERSITVTSAGSQDMIVKSEECEGGSILYNNFEVTQYQEYNTIWFQMFSDIFQDTLGLNQKSTACRFDMTLPLDQIRLQFYVGQYTPLYLRYPDSLISGLSKVGGIVAVFQISILIRWFHKRQYERYLIEQSKLEITEDEAKTRYSIENFERLIRVTEDLQRQIKQYIKKDKNDSQQQVRESSSGEDEENIKYNWNKDKELGLLEGTSINRGRRETGGLFKKRKGKRQRNGSASSQHII